MTVKEIRDAVHQDTVIRVHDRLKEETVYEGPELTMRTFWDDREVKWICPYNHELWLYIE